MRIGIDARFLTHPQQGGFKTYSEHLVAALAEIDAGNDYLLYVDRPPAPGNRIPDAPNVHVRVVPGTLPAVGMPVREQAGLALRAARDRLDLFHAPCLTAPLTLACPLIVTIHDTIWLHPKRFRQAAARSGARALMEQYYRLLPALAARRAAAVITVSHAAKADVVVELGLDPARVVVTHEAAKPTFGPLGAAEAARARSRFKLAPGYLLAMGSADPRKNIETLLRAYAAVPGELRQRHPLAIVWTHQHLAGSLGELASSLGIAEQIVPLARVDDAELAALYAGAAAFVFPSRYEGFGLPPLEAMACGTPVIAADNSSIPEIVGDAALLVNAESVTGLAGAIERVLREQELRSELSERGLRRAGGFSWRRCAEETLAIYRTIARPGAVVAQDTV